MPRRLSIDIEHIHIRGDPSLLSEPVSDIDRRLQELANDTEYMRSILLRYSSTNQGEYYSNCVDAIHELSETIYDVSEILNDLQHQVVEYHIKINILDGKIPSAPSPQRHNVQKIIVQTNTGEVEFNREEMLQVHNALTIYLEQVYLDMNKLNEDTENIGFVWRDEQYKLFYSCIEEVSYSISAGCRKLEEYRDYLASIISNI